ncbi:hypothetical protein E8E13_005019 [Curvularia kusanoi]|uniref:Uncharacterized protein n=1 Tax=Curvularia kusanoi TaxID=90978 RepID=A0A9P4W9N8_CURKU|nr:hypothetical protein E8E13_005019 [Curvularia kusanoi]
MPNFPPLYKKPVPERLIPARYSIHDSDLDGYDSDDDWTDERNVRILPFNRNVFRTSHGAQTTDFLEISWLLRHGTTELWYEKPSNALLKRMNCAEESGTEADELTSSTAKPSETETPKVWASAALTTPTDKRIHVCDATHKQQDPEDSLIMTCKRCTVKKSNALQATDLAYCLVFSTAPSPNFMVPPGDNNNRQMYKLVKCGSREAAISEVFHAVGLHGLNLVFSCVMRASEDVLKRGGKFKRVSDLWMLGGADRDEEGVRVFY